MAAVAAQARDGPCHREIGARRFLRRGFDYYGVRSRFFRKDGKFLVETDGPDGKLATFEVKYTFGLDPLQQYLIEFPDGRLQALSIAWDSRPKEQGGQRWFHLYPNEEIKHDDVLHWTRLNQNWNFMCAECHSTGVRKNYDAANDRFATTWAEISVGCEACHGQGSRHVAWARERQSWWPFGKTDDPRRGSPSASTSGATSSGRSIRGPAMRARNYPPALLRKEVETCGLCHARRGAFSEDGCPGGRCPTPMWSRRSARGLYHADGQMLDEVYNYGSFKQSKMFAAGVTCSDCHEPHGAKLRAAGDGVCLQCHASDKYAAAAHHRHEAAKPAARLRVVPHAGAHLHGGRSPARSQLPRSSPRSVGEARHAQRLQRLPHRQDRGMGGDGGRALAWAEPKGLAELRGGFPCGLERAARCRRIARRHRGNRNVPAFARASALTELGPICLAVEHRVWRGRGCPIPTPWSRIGALDMLEGVPANQLWPLVSPLLSDSSRGVRIRAASLLAAVPTASQPPADRERFERAAAEFVAAQRLNADRPEARATLGNFYARRALAAEPRLSTGRHCD